MTVTNADGKAIANMEASLDAVEQEFVSILTTGDLFRGDAAAGRVLRMIGEVRRVLALVKEAEERRDLTYRATHRLRELHSRCLWLYRRIVQERLFARRVELERQLKAAISPEAYEIYLALQVCDIEEEATTSTRDEQLTEELLT